MEGETDNQADIERMFSTDADNVFLVDETPKATRAKVFYYHYFEGRPYSELAEIFGKSEPTIRNIYYEAKETLLAGLKILEQRRRVVDDVESRLKISEKATGKMPKTHKWFLLNKVFGLLPREIAEMDDAKVTTVCARIKDVADRVMTGNLIFLDPTPDQIEKAQGRIDKKRARDRKRV